jgi:hypothetical protein
LRGNFACGAFWRKLAMPMHDAMALTVIIRFLLRCNSAATLG